ncbi:phosphoribosylglycinamide synthetase C domain-containing protein, partial [Candidatus Hydrogenedentota bacterium]
PVLEACADGTLDQVDIQWKDDASVCVVAASGGYPGSYEKDKEISGINDAESAVEDMVVFHAGTSLSDGKLVTNGGRVLGITALGQDIEKAIAKAYTGTKHISFDGMVFREDIGAKALNR